MRNLTGQCHLEEAFRQELFRLINQYLSFPEDATLGAIVRTLVNFQQVSAVIEAYDSTLVMVDKAKQLLAKCFFQTTMPSPIPHQILSLAAISITLDRPTH